MEHAGDGDAPRRTPEGPEDRLRAVVGGTPQHPHAPHAPPSDAARRDAPGAGPDAARPMSESERNSVRVTSGPAGALAGAAAGATAGLVSGPFGPIAAGIGAIVGAVVGGSMGAVSGQAVANPQFGAAEDAH